MRIVTYARVSTKGQADRGISLHDQETRLTEWLKRSKHTRMRAYAEAMSGGKNMQEPAAAISSALRRCRA